MLILPLSAFYFFQFIIFKNDRAMLMWSGFVAVAAANVVIFFYVRMAWTEDYDANSNVESEILSRKVR